MENTKDKEAQLRRGEFDGVGRIVDDARLHVILSRGRFLFGRIEYITERQGMMVVWTTHRRCTGTIMKSFKFQSCLKQWEDVCPPRYMLAVEGRVVQVAPPE